MLYWEGEQGTWQVGSVSNVRGQIYLRCNSSDAAQEKCLTICYNMTRNIIWALDGEKQLSTVL